MGGGQMLDMEIKGEGNAVVKSMNGGEVRDESC